MKKGICLLLAILLISGCSTNNGMKGNPVAKVTDDIPGLNIPEAEINYSQFDGMSSKMEAWGLGKDKDENNQPVDAVKANQKYAPYDSVFVGKPNQKVYLTFDNGYENGNSPEILDILKEKKVHAVFFLTAQYVNENTELVQRMIDEGHIIGNHSYHHPSFATVPLSKVKEEIMSLDQLMMEKFQYKMNLVRPPKGEFTEQTLALCNLLGYQNVLWSYAYFDYDVKNQPDPTSSLKKNLDNAHPGAIYLLHSISDTNVKILPGLIDGLRELNYEVADYDLK